MSTAAERIAFPLTFLFRQEGEQWVSLACEVDVASCGESRDEAREGLKDAVELYIAYLLEAGERAAISRPVPREAIAEFRSEAGDTFAVERHTLVVVLKPATPKPKLRMEFIPTGVEPAACDVPLAAAG